MAKRRTSRPAGPRPKILKLQVSSPRIVYLRVFGLLKRFLLLVLVPVAVVALIWAVGLGLQRAFLENEEFRLAMIDLNPNPVLDERRLVEIGAIDVEGSIFEVNITGLEAKLAALPELSQVRVERELPGTLRVRALARTPVAWLELPGHAISGRDLKSGLLIDERGIPFPCVADLVDQSVGLPVIVIDSPDAPTPRPGTKFRATELTHGMEMLKLARSVPGMDEFPIERIEQENDWSVLVHVRGGLMARFGLLNRERQFDRLVSACRHARDKGYQLATIDLIPERNIPVTFAEPPPPPPSPPRAIPVAEPAEPSPGPEGSGEPELGILSDRG